MAQELPFLNFTAEDVASLTPVNSQCTVLCEVDKIWPKEGKNGGTNIFWRFVVIDENSPEKGRPALRVYPLGYPSMFAPLIAALQGIDKSDIKPGPLSLADFVGKQLMVKFDLADNGKGEFTIQPVDYFPANRPLI